MPATNKYSDASKYRAADVVFTLFAPNPGPIVLLQPKTARELKKKSKNKTNEQKTQHSYLMLQMCKCTTWMNVHVLHMTRPFLKYENEKKIVKTNDYM